MSIYVKDPEQPACACVIWMHGLGADSDNMMTLAKQLRVNMPLRHVFLDAPVRAVTVNNHMPMRAWYDIVGVKLTDREDRSGIAQSEQRIRQVIDEQKEDGFASQQIYLAGFSQGGAMALYAGLRMSAVLGGIISLSAYLPLAEDCQRLENKKLPVFLGVGDTDPIVYPDWTKQAYALLASQGFDQVVLHEYPMEHAVCSAEIRDISHWLNEHLAKSTPHAEGSL